MLRELIEEAMVANVKAVVGAAAGFSMSPKTMLKAFETAKASSSYATAQRLGALYDALDPTEEEAEASESGSSTAPTPLALLEAVCWKLSSLPSTLDEDEAALRELDQALISSEGRTDPRLMAALKYRVGYKRQLELARTVLEAYMAEEAGGASE